MVKVTSWARNNPFMLVFSFAAGLLTCLSLALPLWAEGKLSALTCAAASIAGALALGAAFVAATAIAGNAINARGARTKRRAFENGRILGAIVFATLLISFLFSLLSVYPGFCGADSMDIIRQATGDYLRKDSFRYDGLTNHHPVFYTLMVSAVFQFMLLFSASIGLQVFSFLAVQAALFALGCTYAICWLNSRGAARGYTVAVTVIMALLPLFAVHAITLWKDGLFAIAMLCLSLKAADIATMHAGEEKHVRNRDIIQFGCFATLVALLRNNGIFVDIAVLAWLIVCIKEQRRQLATCAACVLAFFLVVQGPIFSLFKVEQSRFSESLGIPLQQIALAQVEGRLTSSEKEFVEKIIPVENLEENYREFEVNPIKFDPAFNDTFLESHKLEFLSVWFGLTTREPATSARAWIKLTKGIWQPGTFAKAGTANSIAGSEPEDKIGLHWNPRIAYNFLEKNLPYLLSKGSIILLGMWLSLLAVALHEGKRARYASQFIPLLALFATILIATPSGWDYRYVLPFATMLPFVFFFIAPRSNAADHPASRSNAS